MTDDDLDSLIRAAIDYGSAHDLIPPEISDLMHLRLAILIAGTVSAGKPEMASTEQKASGQENARMGSEMGTGYGAHAAAVGFAGLKVQELENDLHEAELKHAEVLAMVITVTGDRPMAESARGALEFTDLLLGSIQDAIRLCEQVKNGLNEYSQAWMGPGQ